MGRFLKKAAWAIKTVVSFAVGLFLWSLWFEICDKSFEGWLYYVGVFTPVILLLALYAIVDMLGKWLEK